MNIDGFQTFSIDHSMMKFLISILFMAAIYLSYYQTYSSISQEVKLPESSFVFPESTSQARQLSSVSEYQVISEKPLFDEDRAPEKIIVKERVVQQKVVERELKLQALGIAVADNSFLAVLKDLTNGKIFRLRLNEEFDGWSLASVSKDSFVFVKGKNSKVIAFRNNEE